MSICCYQSDDIFYQKTNDRYGFIYLNDDNKMSKRKLKKFKCIDIKIFEFNINMMKLTKIMNNILTDFCEASVIGYEKKTNKFWCKKYDDKNCSLHMELEISYQELDITIVKFIPVIGRENQIENFVSNFTESIELYRSSPFIRSCLEGTVGL
jgi:hypothetical protein